MARGQEYFPAHWYMGDWVILPQHEWIHFKPFRASTHKAAQDRLDKMLRVSGPRGLAAMTATGAVVVASLYEGQDFILPAPKRGKK